MAKKPKTQAQLKKLLWKHFAKYIKLRDRNICFTCGLHAEGRGMHSGHYIVKGACGLEYYFHEKNVHAQCYRCNINLSGNSAEYRKRLIQEYGEKAVKDLETNYHNPSSNFPFEDKIAYYKGKVESLL